MKRRSLFLSLAAGLVATMAFATPSEAGSVTQVTTTAIYIGAPVTIDSLVVNYSFSSITPAFSDLNLVMSSPPGSLSTSTSGSTGQITETYSANSNTSVGVSLFTFDIPVGIQDAPTDLTITSAYFVTSAGDVQLSITPTFSLVPEPASMALLGIGMTGLLAFRRLLSKRNSVI